MSLIKELKRRNVFKVGAAYLAVAWLIAQVSDLALGSFGAPDWILKTELFLLAIGFPLALIFAWAFELTPKGIRRETSQEPSEGPSGDRSRKLDYVIVGSLALALGYFAWDRQDQPIEITETVDRSIAVLPFVNRSGDAEQDWFADGLTEEIINSLTRTPDLRVTASTSSFAFKDSNEDIRTISDSLGVAHILEGSVRRSADTLRIAVQLIRASDGSNLWSATFDRTIEDVIEIQEEIAIEIANALETAIDPEALAAMVSAGTHSVTAYEAYLKGLALRYASGGSVLVKEADAEFARAVSIDPEFASAHYERAFIRISQLYGLAPKWTYAGLTVEEIERQFYESIDNAIQYEDDAAVKIRYRARRSLIDMNFRLALQQLNEYLELRPGDEYAMVDRFIVLRTLALRDQAVELAAAFVDDDVTLNLATEQALQAMFHADDPKAISEFTKKIVDHSPENTRLLYQAHKAYLWAMNVDEARSLLQKITSSNYRESGKALAQLRQACAEKRESDARQYHAELLDVTDRLLPVWLANRIIGDNSNADKLLMEYDERRQFHILSPFLQYGEFDPKILPNLMTRLAGQGIEDREIFEIPFRCNR